METKSWVAAPGQFVGPFRLERAVARGGMGEIWRAVDTRDGQLVAVKRLFFERASPEAHADRRARLIREARALKQLEHPNIVRYLDAGMDEDGQPYLALEWLVGEDLAQRQKRKPLLIDDVLDAVRQALRGLGVCHAQGIVHRDLKPANLFLVPGENQFQIKLLDLGLAMLGDATATHLTAAGKVLGTLHYLSPEQARGGSGVDQRTDIYAMGVILYQLCAGQLPFRSREPMAVLLKIVSETPARPRELRPELPPWLDDLIVKAMQRAPSDRFDSAAQMLSKLEQPHAGAARASPEKTTERAALAETTALTVPSSSLEYRMVCLLCVQPTGTSFELAATAGDAVAEAGGAVHHLLGGQVVGIFGLDRTHGDEGIRAVRAGLAVRDHAGREARLLACTVHVQVREGLQLKAGDLDHAISMLSLLPPGELVLDARTRQHLGAKIEVKQVGTHDAVLGVSGDDTVRSRVSGIETPTVGRETELAALRAAFCRAADNQEAEVALVTGPLGIGKTRLVNELLPELRERCSLCLEGRAESTKSAMPYGLWNKALLRKAGAAIGVGRGEATRRTALSSFLAGYDAEIESDDVAFIGEAIGVPFDESPQIAAARADPKLMRERVVRAFVKFVGAAAARGPVCLCFEDLQWADEESLCLCEALLERLERAGVFVLVTARAALLEQRPKSFSHSTLTRLELGALRRRSLARLMAAILGGRGFSADLEKRVAEWSDGNPYFVEELLRWLSSQDALVIGEQGCRLRARDSMPDLPVGIEGAIQGRLDQLDPSLKELLKGAAVFGEVFWEAGCETLGLPGVATALARLQRSQFVVPCEHSRITGTREWTFRHPLVQQVAYRMLPPEYRRTLHRQAARWLESMGETDAAWLAYHFHEGGDEQRAADYAASAGARCLADGDLKLAIEYYRASIHEENPRKEQARRILGLGRALSLLGDYDDALVAVAGIASDLGGSEDLPDPLRAELGLLQGWIGLAQGRYREAETHLVAAVEHVGDGDPVRFEINKNLFWVIWVQGRYEDASKLARWLTTDAELGDRPDHLCSARLAEAYCSINAADYGTAIALGRQAVDHARGVGHPYREVDALMLLGSIYEQVGQYEAATHSLRSALELASRLRTAHHQVSIHASIGQIELARGCLSESLDHLNQAIDQAEQIGESRMLAIGLGAKARALCMRNQVGDLPQAENVALRALMLAEQRAPPVEAEALMAMIRVRLASGEVEEAIRYGRVAVALLEGLGMPENEIQILLAAHDAFSNAGHTDEARAALSRAVERLGERAEKISDPRVRQSFLTEVPHNARVLALEQGR